MTSTPQSSATITSLFRYPVKGLSPEKLAQVALTPGATVPFEIGRAHV